MSRHGRGHPINPTEIPNRANIAAMKALGVELILSFSAVGSLREDIKPTDFVLPKQLIDFTKGVRPSTFFENGCVAHVEFADPFCEEMENIVLKQQSSIEDECNEVRIHSDKTLIVMEGPAFSTRAESHMYRSWGCDIINMSTAPEAKLAREAEISYLVVCMATDYDCWREVPGEDVSVESVLKTLNKNSETAKKLLLKVLPDLEKGLTGKGKGAVNKGSVPKSMITSQEARSSDQMAKLDFLFPGMFD